MSESQQHALLGNSALEMAGARLPGAQFGLEHPILTNRNLDGVGY